MLSEVEQVPGKRWWRENHPEMVRLYRPSDECHPRQQVEVTSVSGGSKCIPGHDLRRHVNTKTSISSEWVLFEDLQLALWVLADLLSSE